MITTKPTIKRPGLSQPLQVAGLPRASQLANSEDHAVKYQWVYHLTPENLLQYEAMTYPSLQQRWQTQPQRGELFGVSASVAGEMIGFVVAEYWQESGQAQIELLSSHVLPAYRHQPIEKQLYQHIQPVVNDAIAGLSSNIHLE